MQCIWDIVDTGCGQPLEMFAARVSVTPLLLEYDIQECQASDNSSDCWWSCIEHFRNHQIQKPFREFGIGWQFREEKTLIGFCG
ncbi:hypothetical protein ElyMa_002764200 [Elysia marginata]|uniref:FBA domain-containing protein n=1 Tax=Elysia marginata TaxID=1093978 RepID=A0AAV4HLY7_9GAST|nr:hypothetical protein ElyMa_002764200 [Elysia marginata]